MFTLDLSEPVTASVSADWVLVYATVDQPLGPLLAQTRARWPRASVFGCTSFQGVFSQRGFHRGAFALGGGAADGLACAAVGRATNAAKAKSDARAAATEIQTRLGRTPHVLLLHATPGFEERVLEGISEAFGGAAPPLYGGSAADDDLSGKWSVFYNGVQEREGFVLAGFKSDNEVYGSFVAGYNPGVRRGKVTAAMGRRIRTIDGRPAAEVYDEWLGGALKSVLKAGGVVLAQTTLHPLGRLVDHIGAVPRYVLSHPHEVFPDGSMSLFTEFATGDEVVLMVGSSAALVDRTDQVATRASRGAKELRAGVLVYCAGCVGAIGGETAVVARRFYDRIGRAPFIGAATFGEQGCFQGTETLNRHGNLMCDAILFG
ncbi:MAG: FIST N-terminal domain-containing protein [Polyangiaceae bacterium]